MPLLSYTSNLWDFPHPFLFSCSPPPLPSQPLIGYWSDHCCSPFGRRRPFILAGAVAVCLAVLLIAFSADMGSWMGDPLPSYSPSQPPSHSVSLSSSPHLPASPHHASLQLLPLLAHSPPRILPQPSARSLPSSLSHTQAPSHSPPRSLAESARLPRPWAILFFVLGFW